MVEETGEGGLKHHCCSKKMICDAYLMTMSFLPKHNLQELLSFLVTIFPQTLITME